MNLTDQELVERCRGTDGTVAYRQLVERYQRPVYAYVAGRLGDPSLARDATQEAFVRAYFSLGTLRKPAALHAWLLGIAGRVALEQLREQRRRGEVPEQAAAGATEPAVETGADDDSRLDEAIAALPELPRRLILLRYFDQLSCQEIAARLRMPLGSVTKTLSRAYGELRTSLQATAETTQRSHLEKHHELHRI